MTKMTDNPQQARPTGPRDGLAGYFADIGHDLKTYLNPIIGFTSLLLQDSARLAEDQQNYVRLVYRSAKQLLDRIDAMVELLRLYSGDVEARLTECYCREVVEQVRARFMETDGNRLELDLTDDTTKCRCAPSLLVGLLSELVRFRLKVKEESRVRLGFRPADADRSEMEFFIGDDGPELSALEFDTAVKLFAGERYNVRPRGGALWMVLAAFYANHTGARVLISRGREKFRVLVEAVKGE